MAGYEAFHVAMRTAIERRGLTLDRLRDHLAARDVRISTSTLSNWQRGSGLPRSPESLRALAALEEVLGVPTGALVRHVDHDCTGEATPEFGTGMPRGLAAQLRERLGASDAVDVQVLCSQDEIWVGPDASDRLMNSRRVIRAGRSGLDRHVVLYHSDTSHALPVIQARGACRLGRTLRRESNGMLAAELLFAPLERGETFPLEYEIRDRHEDPYHGSWFKIPGQRYELTVHLDPALEARAGYRIRRTETGLPNRDVGPVRVIGSALLHLLVPEVAAGFHGVRWE